jgi:predicted O-linked N-acetylglucosamine transferase (SPINDLY family)
MNRKERRAAAKAGKPPARLSIRRATDRAATHRSSLFANAARCYQAGQFGEANRACRQILALDPDDIAALHLSGLIALQVGRNDVAIDILGRAIELDDKIPDFHSGIAEALQRSDRFEEAIIHYRRALSLDPNYIEALYNFGNVLLKLQRHEEALANYDRAVALAPTFTEAIHNRGSALFELQRYAEALADFDRVLAIKPAFASALANRGAALVKLSRDEEGLASCDRALALDPSDVTALAHRGNARFELRRFAEAARDFDRLLTIDPDYPYAAGRVLYFRLLHCDWTNYDQSLASVASKVTAGKRAVPPFMFLNMSGSVEAQMRCAQTFSADKHPASADPVWRGERYEHEKIRIAYLSADFRHHPMAYLMAGLFETHDRSRFETAAISFGPDPQDDFRKRLENSFDRFLDVQTKNDRDIALLLKELEIDIAVDLMGYTNNCRPGILAARPAPVQVNYVGFAGTLGANYIDYILADRFVIPDEHVSFYTENVVYLPDTYWPTDSGQTIDTRVPTRGEAGLPEAEFVFCCFNQNYKIAPPVFDVWVRLLRQVEGSVLWLVEDNADAARNLRQEAQRRGVSSDRLVFAPRVKLEEYLARLRLADLFLDTLPFNAHTTASDALWAGLPVVTCAGSSFAARVAGSLLHAIGLPELITDSLRDYETLVLQLAREPDRLAQIKSKLARNRQNFPLFDTARFRSHIESAYQTMLERHQRGEPPAGFAVPPIGRG